MSLKSAVLVAVLVFSIFSFFLFIHHETSLQNGTSTTSMNLKKSVLFLKRAVVPAGHAFDHILGTEDVEETESNEEHEELILSEEINKGDESEKEEEISHEEIPPEVMGEDHKVSTPKGNNENHNDKLKIENHQDKTKTLPIDNNNLKDTAHSNSNKEANTIQDTLKANTKVTESVSKEQSISSSIASTIPDVKKQQQQQQPVINTQQVVPPDSDNNNDNNNNTTEKRGLLYCNGTLTNSEVIYWKIVPGDKSYESSITPHHGLHHDRYLSFEYDAGGWNNIRMGMECTIVMAHAMGRTLVVPPPQNLYLLGKHHIDEKTGKKKAQLGFEDFFDFDLLKSHQGFHVLSMKEFLEKEAVTGGLKGMLPPKNSSSIWGGELWWYLNYVADEKPSWSGKFLALPDRPGDFDLSEHTHPRIVERMRKFGGDRSPVFYDDKLQKAHHIHFSAGDKTR
eukprot:gene13642-28972_t